MTHSLVEQDMAAPTQGEKVIDRAHVVTRIGARFLPPLAVVDHEVASAPAVPALMIVAREASATQTVEATPWLVASGRLYRFGAYFRDCPITARHTGQIGVPVASILRSPLLTLSLASAGTARPLAGCGGSAGANEFRRTRPRPFGCARSAACNGSAARGFESAPALRARVAVGGWHSGNITHAYDTETAVLHFQKSNGLTADGIVGPKSWAALT